MKKELNKDELQNYLDQVFFETLDEYVSPFLCDTRHELIKTWNDGGRKKCTSLVTDPITLINGDNVVIKKYIQDFVRAANPVQRLSSNPLGDLQNSTKEEEKLDIIPASSTVSTEKNIFSDLSRLYTSAFLDRVREIVDDASDTDMRLVYATGVHELVHRINYKMMELKSDGYRRFNYQVWYDQKEGCIRLQLFDPYGTLQDDEEYRVFVNVDEAEDLFSDIPEDDDVDDDTETLYPRLSKEEKMYRRTIILSVFKLMEDNGIREMSISVPHLFLGTDTSAKNTIRTMARIGLLKHRRVGKSPLKTYYSLSETGKAELEKSEKVRIPWRTWFENALVSFNNESGTIACNFFSRPDSVGRVDYFERAHKLLLQLQRQGIVRVERQKVKLTNLGKIISKCYKEEME